MVIKKNIKQKLAFLLLIILVLTNSMHLVANAAQSGLLGSQAALGSPLTSDSFVVDDWDPWELLCFGLFLSNFCQPFEDDYTSAFTEGSSYGTQGRGLKALQFAAGGDATASGYLYDMVEYCKSSQQEAYRNIYVDYSWYEYNSELPIPDGEKGGLRQAYVDDLLPKLYNYERTIGDKNHITIFTNRQVSNPMIAYSFTPLFHGDENASKSDDELLNYLSLVDVACLPRFYASKDGSKTNENLIFDYTDNWDIQIIKALFAKTFNKNTSGNFAAGKEDEEDGMNSALESIFEQYLGRTCPLVMDTYGNICMQYQGRNVIIIPASSNQHLTAKNSYNYLNSLVLNNYVLNSNDTNAKIVGNAESEFPTGKEGMLWWSSKKHRVGNFPIKATDSISKGRLIIHSDTDTQLFQKLYKDFKDVSENTVSYQNIITDDTEEGNVDLRYTHSKKSNRDIPQDFLSDYNFGKVVGDLVGEKTFYQQAIQFDITGATSVITDDKFSFPMRPEKNRDDDKVTIDTSLGGLGLLSSLFATIPTVEEANVLDYIYIFDSNKTLENTKMNIFGDSYYITPRIAVEGNGLSGQSAKLYVNYFMKSLQGKTSVNNMDTAKRDAIWNNLNKQNGFANIGKSMLVTPETTFLDTELTNNYKANVIYKSFMEKYYEFADEDYNSNTLLSDLSLGELDGVFGDPSIDSLDLELRADYKLEEGISRVCRIYKPSEMFNALASVFSLDDACQFEVYSPYIYITYLDFYGFLGSKDSSINNFNQTLFDGAYFKDFSGDNFKNAMTAEQRDEAVKLNVFKLLSLDDEGSTYRKHLAEDFVKSFFVKPLDETLNKKSIGNVGIVSNFLHVSTLEDNFMIGDLIKEYWGVLSLLLFGILSLIAIFSGALNHRSIGWYITILASSVTMVYSIPYYLDITPIMLEKYINTHFDVEGSYWALAESIHLDETSGDLANSTSSATQAIALLNTLNFLDTDSTLMIKQDISQKVVSISAIDYSDLQRLKTARWLLPGLMQQMSSTSNNYDYVSVPITRLYNNYARLWVMYHPVADYIPTVPEGDISNKADQYQLMDVRDKAVHWVYNSNNGYKDTSASVLSADKSTKSISRLGGNQPTHTGFYLLQNLKMESVYAELGKSSLTQNDWELYAEKVSKSKVEPLVTNTNSIRTLADNMLADLNNYNQYTDPIKQEFGYLWTTENLGSYFYLLVKDTFESNMDTTVVDTDDSDEESEDETNTETTQSSSIGNSLAYVMLQLQGSNATNEEGKDVRTSFMHYGKTGYIRDVCDMEEVFTNLMPYMYQMMIVTNGTTDHNGVLGADKMVGNPYYSENYKSWMFRCNWVTKIYEDSLYHSGTTVQIKDDEGNVVDKYRIQNISDPRSYPEERPMVFSEAQMYEQNLTTEDLTFTELKILEFNQNVVKRWTTLINYANTSGLKKEHIYRQMAIEALFAFNETFTRDNIIVSAKTLYPLNYDLRNLSLITVLRSLISNLTKNASYMTGDLAVSLYDNYGFGGYLGLLVIYWSFMSFSGIRDIFMVLAFLSAIATLAFNFGSTSQNKFKSIFGWVITSVLYGCVTVCYYWIINFLIGNPTQDSLVNISKMTSSSFSTLSFGLWSILIVILTLIYGFIIVIYFYELWIGHKFGLNIKDGGFGFYYAMTDKVVGAVKDMAGKAGKHLSGIHDGLAKFGPGYDPEEHKKGRTKTDAKLEGGKAGSYAESKTKKTSNNDLQGTDLNSNYNSGGASDGNNTKVTSNIQQTIEKGKQIDSGATVESKLQSTIENILSASVDFYSNPVNWNEQSGLEALQKIATQAADSYVAEGIHRAKHIHDGGEQLSSEYKIHETKQQIAKETFDQARKLMESQHQISIPGIDKYSYHNTHIGGNELKEMYGHWGGLGFTQEDKPK